jgi:ankyrin repeat protein
MEAVHRGHEGIVKILLDKGAAANCQDETSLCRPLYVAASEGNVTIVKLLLESGANPNLRNCYGQTALLVAIIDRQLGVVDLLLKSGANVNQECLGWTPLHAACNRPKPAGTVEGAIVRLLLQAGANVEAKDDRELTSLSYAIGHVPESGDYFEEGVKLLLKAGATVSPKDWKHLRWSTK